MDEDKRDPKFKVLDGGNKPNELKNAIEIMEEQLPHLIKLAEINAKLAMAKYSAYRKAGFDEKQALELCKQPLFQSQ